MGLKKYDLTSKSKNRLVQSVYSYENRNT
uniref:Uncharacterized protein n=1 Tax=Anguilla anguilla TaxID=7936 RepID=A0A0E9SX73_ANGAN